MRDHPVHKPWEIMILTEAAAVEEADSLRVVFKDGGTAAGTLKQKDSLGGLAVVSVAEAEVQEAARERIKAVELGNSQSGNWRPGDCRGKPCGGIVHSVKQGAVSYWLGTCRPPMVRPAFFTQTAAARLEKGPSF